jgi:triacylglycerol esterase/lipase EstA (alpha/beta hydrolase family)
MNDKCKTKYPFVMVHGTGFRDRKHFGYWGRIPKALESEGATIYFGHQDSWGTVEQNAKTLQENINKIMLKTGNDKFNVITHSKGGLDMRYLISSLGMSDNIVSLTTICTPHHGSKTMDKLFKLPSFLFKIVSVLANLWFRMLGDDKPDFHAVCGQFTTDYACKFNMANPDSENVYYQSYGAVMKNSFSDLIMFIPHLVVKLVEGENDGLLTPSSANWTNFKGVLKSGTRRGISHADEVDIRRMKISKKPADGHVNDICDVYIQIASELKQLGY